MHVGACVCVERPLYSCLSAQYVTCDTKLRDQCKGTPCNRCGSDKTNNTGWNLEFVMFYFPKSSDMNALLAAWMLQEK